MRHECGSGIPWHYPRQHHTQWQQGHARARMVRTARTARGGDGTPHGTHELREGYARATSRQGGQQQDVPLALAEERHQPVAIATCRLHAVSHTALVPSSCCHRAAPMPQPCCQHAERHDLCAECGHHAFTSHGRRPLRYNESSKQGRDGKRKKRLTPQPTAKGSTPCP